MSNTHLYETHCCVTRLASIDLALLRHPYEARTPFACRLVRLGRQVIAGAADRKPGGRVAARPRAVPPALPSSASQRRDLPAAKFSSGGVPPVFGFHAVAPPFVRDFF